MGHISHGNICKLSWNLIIPSQIHAYPIEIHLSHVQTMHWPAETYSYQSVHRLTNMELRLPIVQHTSSQWLKLHSNLIKVTHHHAPLTLGVSKESELNVWLNIHFLFYLVQMRLPGTWLADSHDLATLMHLIRHKHTKYAHAHFERISTSE